MNFFVFLKKSEERFFSSVRREFSFLHFSFFVFLISKIRSERKKKRAEISRCFHLIIFVSQRTKEKLRKMFHPKRNSNEKKTFVKSEKLIWNDRKIFSQQVFFLSFSNLLESAKSVQLDERAHLQSNATIFSSSFTKIERYRLANRRAFYRFLNHDGL